MKKQTHKQKTYYTLDIKNPYCSKGEFLWKKNDDSKIGKEKEENKKDDKPLHWTLGGEWTDAGEDED